MTAQPRAAGDAPSPPAPVEHRVPFEWMWAGDENDPEHQTRLMVVMGYIDEYGPVPLLVDTGSEGVLLNAEHFAGVFKVKRRWGIGGHGEAIEAELVEISMVQVGGAVAENVEAAVAPVGRIGWVAEGDVVGLLGQGFFERFAAVEVDYVKREIVFREK